MTTVIISGVTGVLASAMLGWLGLRYLQSRRLHRRCVALCHHIADELGREQETEQVIDRVFNVILEHTGAMAGVLVFRNRQEQLEVVRSRGLPKRSVRQGELLPEGSVGWSCEGVDITGGPEVVYRGLRGALASHGVELDSRQNMLCLPIGGTGKIHGMLQIISGPGQCFTPRHLVDLGGMGHYLAAAVHNAHLIGTIRRQRDAVEALYEIGLTISRFLELGPILKHAVSLGHKVMASDLTWFLDCEDRTHGWALVRESEGSHSESFRVGERVPLAGRVLELLKPGLVDPRDAYLLVPDIASDGKPAQREPEDRLADIFCDETLRERFLELGLSSALVVPVAGQDRARGLLCTFSRIPAMYNDFDVRVMQRLANQLLIALNTADLHASRRDLAVVEERQRLSNELHDNMAQIVNGLALEVHSLAGRVHEEPVKIRLNRLLERLEDAKAAIRQAVYELRLPPATGLWENLRDFGARFQVWHELTLQLQIPEESLVLPLEDQREVLRIVQELLWNACKHSGAHRVWLEGSFDSARVRVKICVRDDGRGSVPARIEKGLGMATMRNRAAGLGGELSVETGPDRGLVACLWFPARVLDDGAEPRYENMSLS